MAAQALLACFDFPLCMGNAKNTWQSDIREVQHMGKSIITCRAEWMGGVAFLRGALLRLTKGLHSLPARQ